MRRGAIFALAAFLVALCATLAAAHRHHNGGGEGAGNGAWGHSGGHHRRQRNHHHHDEDVAAPVDVCGSMEGCGMCVRSAFCGWCSNPVTYQNGQAGTHCVNQSVAFECSGVYSTDTCQSGYVCNTTAYQCVLGAPGAGEPLATCQSNCSSVGKTFQCNNATGKCEVAPAGSGTSLQQCTASCHAPTKLTESTHSQVTASKHTATASAKTQTQHTATQHNQTTATHATTTTPLLLYACDVNTVQCVVAPAGKGEAKSVCEAQCTNHSHHTPATLQGAWRGITAGNGYTGNAIPEFDFDFGTVVTDFKLFGNAKAIAGATVQFIGQTAFHLTVSTSLLPAATFACITEESAALPTTLSMMVGCVSGSVFPKSVTAAFAAPTNAVWLLQKCSEAQYCTFAFPPPPMPTMGDAKRRPGRVNPVVAAVQQKEGAAAAFFRQHHARRVQVDLVAEVAQQALDATTDVCSQYKANCDTCLAHPLCGWCSQDVVYKDGSAGTQCAGFNANGQQNDFTCTGTYVTDKCLPGFKCNATSQQCVSTQPGEGIPSKSACDASCKAKPGPPSQLIGSWRGIEVSKGYPTGTFLFQITESNWTMISPSASNPAGVTTTFTSRTMGSEIIIEATVNPYTLQGLWAAGANDDLQYQVLAFGAKNEAAPASFNSAMTGGTVYVIAKCATANCKW